MNIDQFIYFLSVAETGSVNASAKNFFISQQAINQQLNNLENELNTKLFSRQNKGFTLTKQGEIFAKHASNIVEEYRSILMELTALENHQKNQQKVNGTLTIFTASIFADTLLPDIICDFTKLYPYATIKVIEVDAEELPFYLSEQHCDIALLSGHIYYANNILPSHNERSIKILPLLEDRISICVRKDNPIAQYKTIETKTLTEKFPSVKYSFYQIVPMSGKETKYNKSISNSMNVELHKKLILSGIVATFMPYMAYQYKFQDDALIAIPIADSDTVVHCLMYHENPSDENRILLETFILYLYDYFIHRFGPQVIGKRPYYTKEYPSD